MMNITKEDLMLTREERINYYLKAEKMVIEEMKNDGWEVDGTYDSINKYNAEFDKRIIDKINKFRLESYNEYDKLVVRLLGNMYVEMFGEEESRKNAKEFLSSDVFWKLENKLIDMLGLSEFNFFDTLKYFYGDNWAN